MQVPPPRGPLSGWLLAALAAGPPLPPQTAAELTALAQPGAPGTPGPLHDGDLQLALALLYELHHGGLDGVDEGWEWDGRLLDVRAVLEGRVLEALAAAVPRPPERPEPVARQLADLVAADDGPSVSTHLLRSGTTEDYREFLRQRSVYHLKEADPHTWTIPRLSGRAKEALAEIQADEYGGGLPGRMHATMYAEAMAALGLDATPGAYWPSALPETFATVNVALLFGLHRRWRGASAGHLAVLEMSSTGPMRRYANGLRRLGHGPEATAFFDEHVEADAVHEQIAAVDLCGSLVAAEPRLLGDVLWGAACCLAADAAAGAALLQRLRAGGGRAALGAAS